MRKFVGNNPYLCRKYDDIIKSELAMTNPLITIVVPKLRKLNFLQERFPRVLLIQVPMLILNKVTPMVVIQ